jgi:hypothetical protein
VGEKLLSSLSSDRHERAGAPRAAQTVATTTTSREPSGTALGAMLRRLLCCQQEKRRITSSPLHLTQQPPRPRRCAQSGPVPRQDHHERAGTARHCRRAAPATPWSCSREAVHKKSTSFPRPTAAPKLAPCSKAAQPLDGPSLGPIGHSANASRPQRPSGARSCKDHSSSKQ